MHEVMVDKIHTHMHTHLFLKHGVKNFVCLLLQYENRCLNLVVVPTTPKRVVIMLWWVFVYTSILTQHLLVHLQTQR